MALWNKLDDAASRPKHISGRLLFDGSSATAVVAGTDSIVSKRHKLQTGDVVLYSAGGGTVITGLTENIKLYVVRIDADTIKLATTLANAIAVTPTVIDITAVGVGDSHSIVMANVFFVSQEEAALTANHNKGINGGGWWRVQEYTDGDGTPRYKTECLVSMGTPTATSGDTVLTIEDSTVPDAESVIAISVQPDAQATTVALSAATFAVTAALTGAGTIAYQWQRAPAATPNRFSNVTNATGITGATTNSLAYTSTSVLTTANSGDRYRVIMSSSVASSGTAKVVSNAVALTVIA